jgi:hypothetical protein
MPESERVAVVELLFEKVRFRVGNRTSHEPERIQRASHPQDSDASLVVSRPDNSTVIWPYHSPELTC